MSVENQPNEVNFLLDELARHSYPSKLPTSKGERMREALLQKVAHSKLRSADKVLSRQSLVASRKLSPFVLCLPLYEAGQGQASKGEPRFTWVLKLSAHARYDLPIEGHKELVVLSGDLSVNSKVHATFDYAYLPPGSNALSSDVDTIVYVHCFDLDDDTASPYSVHQANATWDDFGPGIQRLLLRNHQAKATVLYRAQPNASVPLHRHLYAEQCFMVEGDLYLDDTLLLAGDYEYAPASSTHELTYTKSGALLLSHTDLELQFE